MDVMDVCEERALVLLFPARAALEDILPQLYNWWNT